MGELLKGGVAGRSGTERRRKDEREMRPPGEQVDGDEPLAPMLCWGDRLRREVRSAEDSEDSGDSEVVEERRRLRGMLAGAGQDSAARDSQVDTT